MYLETNRLILRPWRESDAEVLYRYAKDSRIGSMCGWPTHTSIEDSRRIIREVLSVPETYAVVLKGTKLPIGSIGLHRRDLAKRNDEAELGYWIGVPYWGRGIISEAAREVLRHAFEDLKLTRIWAGYYDENKSSKRVLEKLGFAYYRTETASAPQMNETRKRHIRYLTKEEWFSVQQHSALYDRS